MYRLSKVHPPDREVLKDISLSFLPGAKIGVLGYNGAGKSSLLRIMAGRDTEFRGDAQLAPGRHRRPARAGAAARSEPRTCARTCSRASGSLRALLERFNELAANYSDETADEFARLQEQIDAADAWNLDGMIEHAMDALRCPPADADVGQALRRRAPPRRALPAAAEPARPAAARRADQPPRRRVGRVARAPPRRVQGHGRRRHPRPLLPRQRRRLDPRARPRPRHPLPGQLLRLARAEAGAPRPGARSRRSRASARSPPSSSGCATNPKGRRNKSKARLANYEALLAQESEVKLDQVQIHIPAGPRLGDVVIEADGLRKGFGDRLLIEDLSFSLPRGGIVGVIGPNGAGKTTLFRMITGAGAARRRHAADRRHASSSPTSTSRATRSTPRSASGRRSPAAPTRSRSASAGSTRASTRRRSTSAAPTSRRRSRKLSGGERNRLHLAKLLRSGGNLLLLDEPTNDLDVDTLRALEEALLSFAGCAVVISHDRWFLDRVATHVLAFEGDSQVTLVRGQLRGLRGAPPRAARRRGRPAEADHLQAARALLSAVAGELAPRAAPPSAQRVRRPRRPRRRARAHGRGRSRRRARAARRRARRRCRAACRRSRSCARAEPSASRIGRGVARPGAAIGGRSLRSSASEPKPPGRARSGGRCRRARA